MGLADKLFAKFRGGTEANPETLIDPNAVLSEMQHVGGNPGAAYAHLLERGMFPGMDAPPPTELGGGMSGGGGASMRMQPPMSVGGDASPDSASPDSGASHGGSVTVTYTVRPGDTLIGISKRLLGDPLKFASLYALNKRVIGNNPNHIRPGMQLVVPEEGNA